MTTRAECFNMDSINKTALGLDENLAGVLAYALGWISGIALLVTERENRFVRFHAFQSTIVFGALCILWYFGLAIPFLGWAVAFLIITPLSAVIWLLMMFKAYHGERFKLPFAGAIAEQRAEL